MGRTWKHRKKDFIFYKKNISLKGSMSQLALDWASLGCVLVVLFLCVPRSFYLFSSLVLWISVFYISSCCHIDTFASSGPVGVLDLARHFTSFSFFQCWQLRFPVDLTFRLKWSKTLSDSHIVITAFLSPTSTKWVGGLHLWLHIVFTRGILKMVLVPMPPKRSWFTCSGAGGLSVSIF